MNRELNTQQTIRQKTLEEVEQSSKPAEAERHPCVICLEDVSEKAVAIPCRHGQFDFLCLASWLEERPQCPLCKANVEQIHYDFQAPTKFKVYVVQKLKSKIDGLEHPRSRAVRPLPWRRQRLRTYERAPSPDAAVRRRREVYRRSLFSLHVGTNRISRFQDLSPVMFTRDTELVSRARAWIRRELKVFEYLGSQDGHGDDTAQVRANNAEFLLEYCIAILKTINLRDANGQAEDLLQEFLGRANARLFLHELLSWLRSPYTTLQTWDTHVQYSERLDELTDRLHSETDNIENSPNGLRSRKRRRSYQGGVEQEEHDRHPQQVEETRAPRRYDSYRPRYQRSRQGRQ